MEYLAIEYLEKTAQVLESAYPYTARDATCKLSSSMVGQVKTTGYSRVPPSSAAQLKAALAIEPVCVAVDAGNTVFQSYRSGILNSTRCGTQLDHAITAIGYGSEAGVDYFIVRNSWGATWGEAGYIRMAANVAGGGVCGILLDPVYP
jgi:C1A family cysteine protease